MMIKRKLAALGAVAAAAVSTVTLAEPSHAATAFYMGSNAHVYNCCGGDLGNAYLTIASTQSGSKAYVQNNYGGAGQLWQFWNDGTIRPQNNTNLCLDAAAPSGTVNDGAQVSAWVCNNGLNQKWTWLGDGEVINNFSTKVGHSLCLDAAAPSGYVLAGANVTAWPCNGGDNEKWFTQ